MMLKKKLSEVRECSYHVMSGLECEFYVFEKDEQGPGQDEIDVHYDYCGA